jgi:hypothetical protein
MELLGICDLVICNWQLKIADATPPRTADLKSQITNHQLQIAGWCCHLTGQQAQLTIEPISLSINHLRQFSTPGDARD